MQSYAKKARQVVATRAWVTMLARMLPAWLRARPQHHPSTETTIAQRQLGKPRKPRCTAPNNKEVMTRAAWRLMVQCSIHGWRTPRKPNSSESATNHSMPRKKAAVCKTGLGRKKGGGLRTQG